MEDPELNQRFMREIPPSSPSLGPRTVIVSRWQNGFGFTLRHFIVFPPESAGHGQSYEEEINLDSGSVSPGQHSMDPMDTIFVKNVVDGGPAQQAGLHTGDRVLSVNGEPISGKTYAQVVALVQASDTRLQLLVVPRDEDILQMAYQSSAYNQGPEPYRGQASNIPHPPLLNLVSEPASSTTSSNSATPWRDPSRSKGPGSVASLSSEASGGTNSISSSTTGDGGRDRHRYMPGGSSYRPKPTSPVMTRTHLSGPPSAPPRSTSSKNAVLAHFQPSLDTSTGSYDSLSRYSDSAAGLSIRGTDVTHPKSDLLTSVRHSNENVSTRPPADNSVPRTDNRSSSFDASVSDTKPHDSPSRLGQPPLTKSSTTSRLPVMARPQPYIRSHTTSSLPTPTNSILQDHTYTAKPVQTGSSQPESSLRFSDSSPYSSTSEAKPGQYSRHPPLPTTAENHSLHRAERVSSRSASGASGNINLVTERMKRFESLDSIDSGASSGSAGLGPSRGSMDSVLRSPPRMGYDSVASRVAFLENASSSDDGTGTGDDPEDKWPAKTKTYRQQARPVSQQVGGVSPDTIAIYFRSETPPMQTAVLKPSPEVLKQQSLDEPSEPNELLTKRDRSPLLGRDPSPRQRRNHQTWSRPTSRKPSYLTAINSPHNQEDHEDRDTKITRRTSYLMATGRREPPALRSQLGQHTGAMSKSESQLQPPMGPPSPQPPTTPTKTSNIRKLKSFFGEKTPRIVEATADKGSVFDLPVRGERMREGPLLVKMAISDGKRATDRSWKPMWVLLKKKKLLMFREKASAQQSPTLPDELPIDIKTCLVDIAYDYTKKKHVFRLHNERSEYLFQAEDHNSMVDWIKNIQMCNQQEGKMHFSSSTSELIIQKSAQFEAKTSPLVQPKNISKKNAKTSLRSHSPGTKQRKPLEKEHSESPKGKENRTWKGRMVKKFKRYHSSSSAPMEIEKEGDSDELITGTFGIPLEHVLMDTGCIPLVVEVCTKIVEEKGIENQGIYRVPGNTGAVTMLQNELNVDPENIDLDSEKWMDVNVVSSLLKSFFRKLPEPLITDDLYEQILAANRTENPEKRMLKVKKILHELPEVNFETFLYLAKHLKKISDYEHVNKMDVRNLAIVFAPTLIRKTEESMISMVKDMSDQCRVVESIIQHYEWFFSSWDVDDHVPYDEVPEGTAPVSGMNYELLAKAETMTYGDRSKDLSAKELVSSIFSAANRKIKKRDKSKSSDMVELDPSSWGSEPSFNERNIDKEIELRGLKEQLSEQAAAAAGIPVSSTSTTAANLSSLQQNMSSTSIQSSSFQAQQTKAQELDQKSLSQSTSVSTGTKINLQTSMSSSEDAARDLRIRQESLFAAKMAFITRKDSEGSVSTSSPGSEEGWKDLKAQVNRYPAIQNPDYRTVGLEKGVMRRHSEDVLGGAGDAQGRVAEAGRKPGATGQPLSYQAQQHLRRLQQETQALQVKKEEQRAESLRLQRDRQRIDQELARTKQELETEETLDDYLGSSHLNRPDTASTTSDYSTTSSSFDATQVSRHSNQQSSHYSKDVRDGRSAHYPNAGQSDAVTPLSSRPSKASRDDMEIYRTGLAFDTMKIAGNGTLSRKKASVTSKPVRRIEFQEGGNRPPLSTRRSNSIRRKGSLDSLLDYYEQPEVAEYASSESEDEDEQHSAKFKEKVNVLFQDEHQPGGAGRLQPDNDARVHLAKTGSNVYGYSKSQDGFRDSDSNRHYKKSDPKIGIASRFERTNVENRQATPGSMTSNQREQTPSDYAHAVSKSSEKMYKSSEHLADVGFEAGSAQDLIKSTQGKWSPSVRRRQPKGRRNEWRRHTVGGIQELERFKEIMDLNSSKDGKAVSAWDRLQPLVPLGSSKEPPSMTAWMQQERLRSGGSSPSLLNQLSVHSPAQTSASSPPLSQSSVVAPPQRPGTSTPPENNLPPSAYHPARRITPFTFESSI